VKREAENVLQGRVAEHRCAARGRSAQVSSAARIVLIADLPQFQLVGAHPAPRAWPFSRLPLFFCPPLTSILAIDPCPSSLLLVETLSHAQEAKSATMATSASSADDMVALSPRRVWH